jgi:NAD-dependent deacetylase
VAPREALSASALSPALADWVARALRADPARGPLVFLTGAGISAESGIPTFRGEEGYWRVGSRNHHPTEMATAAAFQRMPGEVWSWYLYRRSVCRGARPNAAHRALAELERRIAGDRFLLVTQNVDGLHLEAGNTPERTYQIHGNIDFCRCSGRCPPALRPLPAAVSSGAFDKDRRVSPAEEQALRCAGCGAWLRPHVLWFDESYDEPLYRFESALGAAHRAAALIVVGTSGATNLPTLMCQAVAARGAPLLVIDPGDTPFTELAARSPAGFVAHGSAAALVPALAAALA